MSASLDIRAEVDEVLACNDRVIAYTYCWRGHTIDGGGDFEIAIGAVQVCRDGRMCRTDRYEHDDREAMLARYAALTGGRLDALGDRPPERLLAELFGRGAARDVDGRMALFAEDFVDADHRRLAWEDRGKADVRVRFEGFLASTSAIRWDVEEVLACDDRVIALCTAMRGTNVDGGVFEIAYGTVGVVENGLLCRYEHYEPDDRRAMIARYAELGGGLGALGDRPPERVFAEWTRCFNGRDVEGAMQRLADDVVHVDHRRFAWEGPEKADTRTRMETFLASSEDLRNDVDEVLACDDRVIAFVGAYRGHSVDGGGEFEIAYGIVGLVENGQFSRYERYEPDDRRAMIARYAELAAVPGADNDDAARSER